MNAKAFNNNQNKTNKHVHHLNNGKSLLLQQLQHVAGRYDELTFTSTQKI